MKNDNAIRLLIVSAEVIFAFWMILVLISFAFDMPSILPGI